MKVQAGRFAFLFCFLLSFQLQAQLFKDLGKNAAEKAKARTTKENREKVVNAVMGDMEKARAEFDSTDFDYAILLSDNSGLFDVKEKGEGAAKVTSALSLGAGLVKNAEISTKDRARMHLDVGEILYANSKFALAERKFALAKSAYEQDSLQAEM